MSKETKNKIVPKLRFPDFRDKEEWEEKEVGEIFEVTRGNVLSMGLVEENRTEETPYPVYSSQTKNNGLAGFYSEYLFEDAITWTTDGANAGDVNFRSNKFYCTNVCGVLINKNGYANKFVASLINSVSKKHVSYVGNPKLMNGVMSKIVIPFPSIPEQQKISNCLSSIDDLITAQTQKLEVLRAHKKGLMQQLFPTEGETVPKLRFEEFNNDAEWEEDVLGGKDIARFINEKISLNELLLESYVSTENLLPNYEGKLNASKFPSVGSVTQFKKNDILLSNIRPYLKKVWFANIDGGASNDVIVIRADSKIDASFLSFLLKNDEFINYIMKGAEGVKMPRGDKDLIKEYPIKFPQIPEQKKIAECLSSLDELIKAQTEKIEGLQKHKKGLMQQLFPNVNE